MKFNMPTASRKRLEELLEYLGKTENYSKYYKGNRAEDFKKCIDIESPWCWKYADIVLRGLEKRDLKYSESHHAVPRAFYGVKRNCPRIDAGNLFTLSYAEHVWAHYCLVWCAIGKMRGKMTRAFITMYNFGMTGGKPLMPSEAELLDAIPAMEIKRIQAMEPRWAKVEAEGRTHYSDDPKQYRKDYREANKEMIAETNKAYREANKEKIRKQHKAHYEANKENILEQKKAYAEANKEKILERNKAWRDANKEQIAEYHKDYYEANKEQIAETNKAHYEANKENILEQKKAYYGSNKEQIAEKQKVYREAKKAAGYRRRKNPLTGKKEWVFVGLPESPKSTKVA